MQHCWFLNDTKFLFMLFNRRNLQICGKFIANVRQQLVSNKTLKEVECITVLVWIWLWKWLLFLKFFNILLPRLLSTVSKNLQYSVCCYLNNRKKKLKETATTHVSTRTCRSRWRLPHVQHNEIIPIRPFMQLLIS